MCKFTVFTFLCGASKYKIAEPCEHMATNVQGISFCRLDPTAHPSDNIYRPNVTESTFGPGVCQNALCRRQFCINPDLVDEDDYAFDMSDEACKEREDRWYRQLLTTDQQLEVLGMQFPIPRERLSPKVRGLVYSDIWDEEALLFNGDPLGETVQWWELNPRYMTAEQLQKATGLFLPQSITDTRAQLPASSSPRKPILGPFRMRDHKCLWIRDGICRDCGRWMGEGPRPESTVHGSNWQRQLDAMLRLPVDGTQDDGDIDAAIQNPAFVASLVAGFSANSAQHDIPQVITAPATTDDEDIFSEDDIMNRVVTDDDDVVMFDD